MRTTKYLLFGALGAAAVLLLTSEQARSIRKNLEDQAIDKANKLKGKLWNMRSSANTTLSELRDLLNDEIEGLSDDARMRIEEILNKTARSADGMKRNIANKLT